MKAGLESGKSLSEEANQKAIAIFQVIKVIRVKSKVAAANGYEEA